MPTENKMAVARVLGAGGVVRKLAERLYDVADEAYFEGTADDTIEAIEAELHRALDLLLEAAHKCLLWKGDKDGSLQREVTKWLT